MTFQYPIVENVGLVDPTAIQQYIDVLFGYVDWGDRVLGLRGIGEKGTPREGVFKEPVWITPAWQNAGNTVAQAAARWAQWHAACFVVPAVLHASAAGARKAEEQHVAEFTTVLADLDKGDTDAKLRWLEAKIGAATMVVYSGGVTEAGKPKLHVYWRLTEPTPEVARVARLRHRIALQIGDDTSFMRSTQIIRVAGTVHAKHGTPRTVSIARLNARVEYELEELADLIEALPTMPGVETSVAVPAGSLFDARPGSAPGGLLDFTPQGEKPPIVETLTADIHEGGSEDRNRWSEFSRTAGWNIHLARQGQIDLNEAYQQTLAWMRAHMVPAWPEARAESEFRALLVQDVQRHGSFPTPAPRQSVQTLIAAKPALAHWDVGEWAMAPPEPRRHLVHGLVMYAQPHTLAAEGGAGKTFLCLDLALRLAVHAPDRPQWWLGEPITEWAYGGTVILVTAEDDRRELHIRLADIDPDGSLREAAKGRLRIVPLVNCGGAFPLVSLRGSEPVPSNRWQAMYQAISEVVTAGGRVTAVIFDTMAAHLHGEDISSEIVTQFFQEASRVCGDFEAAMMVTQHLRKGSADKPIRDLDDAREAVRGSSAVMGSSRVVLCFWHATDYSRRMRAMGILPERGRLYRMGVVKANNPEMFKGMKTLLRQQSGLLTDASHMDRLKDGPGREHGAWLELAVKVAAEGRAAFSKAGANGLYERRAQLPAILQELGRVELLHLAERMLANGQIVAARLAQQKGGHPGHLDIPGGPVARGCGYNDAGAWSHDWSRYAYDPSMEGVFLA